MELTKAQFAADATATLNSPGINKTRRNVINYNLIPVNFYGGRHGKMEFYKSGEARG